MVNLLRHINDPEHPLTLEELNVLETSRVKVSSGVSVVIKFGFAGFAGHLYGDGMSVRIFGHTVQISL